MRESATIAFFVVVGYWFGPESQNPLLKVYESDEEVSKKKENQLFNFDLWFSVRAKVPINEFGEVVVDLQAVAEKKRQAELAVQADVAAINNLKLESRSEADSQKNV